MTKILLAVCLMLPAFAGESYSPEWFETATVEDVQKIEDPNAACITYGNARLKLIHCAALGSQNPRIVQALIDKGADVNAIEPSTGMTALYLTVAIPGLQVNPGTIDVLFKNGAVFLAEIVKTEADGRQTLVFREGSGETVSGAVRGPMDKYAFLLALAETNSTEAVWKKLLFHVCQAEPAHKECSP